MSRRPSSRVSTRTEWRDRPVVLLGLEHGFEARYLLRTHVLSTLASGARLILLVPNADEEYMRREFESPDVAVEALDLAALERFTATSRMHRLCTEIRSVTLGGNSGIETVDDKLRFLLDRQPVLRRLATRRLVSLLRRSRAVRRRLVAWECRRLVVDAHRHVFERYRPDLVVVPGPGFMLADTYLLREARRRGVRTVAVVASWDNTTSRGLAGAVADRYVAWTETMRRELEDNHDVPRDRIFVAGIAHFDVYHRESSWSREKLFEHLGLRHDRRLILFGASSLEGFPNVDVVEILHDAIRHNRLVEPSQVVVRVHPIALRGRGRGVEKLERELTLLRQIGSENEHVHINVPVVRSTRLRVDLAPEETDLLTALMRHSDVVVNVFSTLNLEAALCDRPIVNVGFNGFAELVKNPYLSATKARDRTHNRRILAYGATRVAERPDDLIDFVNQYLREPGLDAPGRQRLIETECGPLDGESGRRIGAHLLRLVGVFPSW